jgi:hypothetical protein
MPVSGFLRGTCAAGSTLFVSFRVSHCSEYRIPFLKSNGMVRDMAENQRRRMKMETPMAGGQSRRDGTKVEKRVHEANTGDQL